MSFGNQKDNNQDDIVAEINMTPLIDIMLVLLIIFMVTSSISLESGMNIDLPKATENAPAKDENSSAVVLSLNKQGEIYVQGKKVETEANLLTAIQKALKDEKTELVVFEGDLNATLGRTVNLMDIAKKAGAAKFALATESGSSP